MDRDSLKQLSQEELNLIINELSNQVKELKEENSKLQEMLNSNKNQINF